MTASAAVRVEKATSDLLLGPDWTLNIDICDSVNSDHGQAKDVIKALKKRLQHKNPKVQFLALTLLETLIKNCGDYVHFQVVERDILQEMIKIVKKKANVQVRDKILTLLDSWQEAFGGPGGKHPHYYWAYAELKRAGIEFPERSPDAAPIFTPPVTHSASLPTHLQSGYGMPANSTLRLDEAMASDDGPSLSLSDFERMQSAVELLTEMLRALNPNDHEAVNDEVITELVTQCRSDQKRIMSLVSSLRDEELLGQALDLNDKLQVVLAKHDAIASGSPLSDEEPDMAMKTEEPIPPLAATVAPQAIAASAIAPTSVLDDEEEEDEDDEFSQLARRKSKFRQANTACSSSGAGSSSCTDHNGIASSAASISTAASPSVPSNALALPDPPAPVRTAPEDQVMNDLLALTIASNPSPPHTPLTAPSALNEGGSPSTAHPQPRILDQGHEPASYNSYVAPWALPQPQIAGYRQQSFPAQSHLPISSSPYPPPPWAAALDDTESNPFVGAASQYPFTANLPSKAPLHALRPLQQTHSFGRHGAASESAMNQNLKQPMSAVAYKPSYVSSNKFFDDLIERNVDGSLKMSNVSGGVSSPYRHRADNGK